MGKDTALVIIDVQIGLFEEGPVYNAQGMLENIASLITKARSADIPIVYVQHCEGEGGSLERNTPSWAVHPSIAPATDDVKVEKETPDSFHQTNLKEELDALGIHKLVITGMQTEMCVDTTCRRAFSLGYDVTLVKDAHSTMDSPHLGAKDIVEHHSQVLRWFADVKETAEVEF